MIKKVLKRWLWCLNDYLMIFPVFIIVSFFAIPKNTVTAFVLLLPVSLLFGIAITCAKKKTKNIFIFLIGLVYVLGVTFLWQYAVMGGTLLEVVFTAVLTAGFFIWGIKSGTGSSRIDFYYFLGIVTYGISILVISKLPALKEFTNITVAAAILLVIAGLPLANRRFLIQETHQRGSLKIMPGTVVRGNSIVVTCTIVLILLLSLWDTVLDAIVSAAKATAAFIIKVLDWFMSLFITEPVQPEGGGIPDLNLTPGEESSGLISDIIFTILVSGIILFLMYSLVKYIIKNYKRIYAAFQSFLFGLFGRFRQWSSTEQGYFDRQESLLKTEIKKRRSFLKRIFKRKPTWKDMKDNASRIRFIYARFVSDNIRKGFNFRPSETPNETVSRINALKNNNASRINAFEKKTDGRANILKKDATGRIHSFEKDKVSQIHASEKETLDHECLRTEYNKVRYGGKEPSDEIVYELKQIYLK
jgi:hypothetical protein